MCYIKSLLKVLLRYTCSSVRRRITLQSSFEHFCHVTLFFNFLGRKITLQGSFELFCLRVFVSFLRWKITLQSSFEHFWLFIFYFFIFYVAESLYRARSSTCAFLLYFLICFTLDNHSTELVWALLPIDFLFLSTLERPSTELVWALLPALWFSFPFLFPSQVRAASTEVF